MALTLLLASCVKEGEPSYMPQPAIRLIVHSVGFTEADVEIQGVNTEKVMYLCLEKEDARELTAEEIIGSGLEVPSGRFKIKDLIEDKEYHLFAA